MNVQELLLKISTMNCSNEMKISTKLSNCDITAFFKILFKLTPNEIKIFHVLKNNESYLGIGDNGKGDFYFQIAEFDITNNPPKKITPDLLIHLMGNELTITKFTNDLNNLMNPDKIKDSASLVFSSSENLHTAFEPDANINVANISLEPNYDTFSKQINAFKVSNLDKVVLARSCNLPFIKPVHPAYIAEKLFLDFLKHAVHDNYFFSYISKEYAFISYTPETLFYTNNNYIETEALAGSCSNIDRDKLLKDLKNIRENDIVAKSIVSDLTALTNDLRLGTLKLKKLSYITHLVCQITANLKDGITTDDILLHLHPTPATLGYPKLEAMQFLHTQNQLNRSLYAGTAGFHDKNKTLMIVLLRSALITSKNVTVYGGAGIMPESEISSEWLETAQKMTPIFQELCKNNDSLCNLIIKKSRKITND